MKLSLSDQRHLTARAKGYYNVSFLAIHYLCTYYNFKLSNEKLWLGFYEVNFREMSVGIAHYGPFQSKFESKFESK